MQTRLIAGRPPADVVAGRGSYGIAGVGAHESVILLMYFVSYAVAQLRHGSCNYFMTHLPS